MWYGSETAKILIIDSHGQPVRWALMMRAARYYASGKVITELGENLFGMAGGIQEATGTRSEFVTSSIVMIRGRHRILTAMHTSDSPSTASSFAIVNVRLLRAALRKLIDGGAHRSGFTRRTSRVDQRRHAVARAIRARAIAPEEANMPLIYVPYAVAGTRVSF